MKHPIILVSFITQAPFSFYNYQASSQAGNLKSLTLVSKAEMRTYFNIPTVLTLKSLPKSLDTFISKKTLQRLNFYIVYTKNKSLLVAAEI